jgi:riboflavin kinase/FMN adenylyltransferase
MDAMEIIHGIYSLKPEHRGCVLTIGNFDGVHHGHRMLLDHLFAKSQELGVPSMLLTFEPQPREYFAGEKVPARLTRFREKITLLCRTDLDRVLCLPFNERTRNTSAEWVTDVLLHELLGIRYIVVGDDFRFGKDARGDYDMLKAAGDRYGFGVSHLGTLTFEHERISSNRIREALAEGKFPLAEQLLGHPYFIMGRVVYGRQLGRQLGVPTANIRLQRYRAALEGTYAVRIKGLEEEYDGVANIGIRPTVDGKEPLLEVHLFDFSGDLYGRLLTVEFVAKIRDEQKFDGLDALKAQIHADIVEARRLLADGADR